jgi:hypothetical protein
VDLAALGQIAASWTVPGAARRKAPKTKPLPEPLQEILRRLSPEAGDARYVSAAALLEDLDQVGTDVPANPEAWGRLLRYVREQASDDVVLRQSA